MGMVYALVACITCLLFCIRPLFGYYQCKSQLEKLQKSARAEKASAERRIQELTTQVNVLKKDADDGRASLKVCKKREEEANKNLRDALIEIDRLNKEKEKATKMLEDRKASAAEITYLRECIYNQKQKLISLRHETVWGELFRVYGRVQKTLTTEQQALVRYPPLNRDQVFFTPEGHAYHTVGWCYTLEKSAQIDACTLDEARARQLEPCSKCVAPSSR